MLKPQKIYLEFDMGAKLASMATPMNTFYLAQKNVVPVNISMLTWNKAS